MIELPTRPSFDLKVCWVIALEPEARPIIDELDLRRYANKLNFPVYFNPENGHALVRERGGGHRRLAVTIEGGSEVHRRWWISRPRLPSGRNYSFKAEGVGLAVERAAPTPGEARARVVSRIAVAHVSLVASPTADPVDPSVQSEGRWGFLAVSTAGL